MTLFLKYLNEGELRKIYFCALAPEPPGNVDYVRGSITSTSVNISWEAPLVTNGVLQKYTIK